MKERPILMSAPMVNAILEGRKTQTRRIVNPQPNIIHQIALRGGYCCALTNLLFRGAEQWIKCKQGQPGDRLWVRETWCQPLSDNKTIWYRSDAIDPVTARFARDFVTWRPSIHMPRWASRITLEVTAIRVERLQDISEEDAGYEGVGPCGHDGYCTDQWTCSYKTLWKNINGPGSWAANPWVWVIEFRRIS